MKTPSPQEAAKMWAKEKADAVWDLDSATAVETALLEADKNGYERGRKEDEALLRECVEMLDRCDFALEDVNQPVPLAFGELRKRLAKRLAGSEGKGGPGKCVCGESSPDRLVIHRTDGPCYLREPEKTVDAEAQKLLAYSGGEKK